MAQIGILLIHGIFGSPREYDDLADDLNAAGYLVRTVTLPGHGPMASLTLNQVTADLLEAHCLAELAGLSEHCDQVVLMGHSLGGICSMLAATHQPSGLAGLIVFSAPYEHAFFVNRPWKLLDLTFDQMMNGLRYAPESGTRFESPLFYPWWFPHLYLESETMLRRVQARLSNIRVPVMLGHSRYDMIVPYDEMAKIADVLEPVTPVITHTFEACGHQIFPGSRECGHATGLILDFLKHHVEVGVPQV